MLWVRTKGPLLCVLITPVLISNFNALQKNLWSAAVSVATNSRNDFQLHKEVIRVRRTSSSGRGSNLAAGEQIIFHLIEKIIIVIITTTIIIMIIIIRKRTLEQNLETHWYENTIRQKHLIEDHWKFSKYIDQEIETTRIWRMKKQYHLLWVL